jgi:type IV pilus assembly protein PilV
MKPSRGFTLMEVLVALVIVAVGLLGNARIQALATRSMGLSGKRALVVQSVASLAASMHANPNFWTSGTAPSFTATPANGIVDSSQQLSSASSDCTSACGAASLAAHDVNQWFTHLKKQLPTLTSVSVTITNATTTPVSAQITVNWTETLTAAHKSAGTSSSVSQSYTLSVLP